MRRRKNREQMEWKLNGAKMLMIGKGQKERREKINEGGRGNNGKRGIIKIRDNKCVISLSNLNSSE